MSDTSFLGSVFGKESSRVVEVSAAESSATPTPLKAWDARAAEALRRFLGHHGHSSGLCNEDKALAASLLAEYEAP